MSRAPRKGEAEPARGFVSLVGAGPGDPGLLTIRGRKAILEADLVLYDHLASPALLSAVDVPGQERIHVGKAAGLAFASQDAITSLMVRRAKDGQRVVRLKGGDPFVFGRGAEEAIALTEAGIPFEIIPGVTSVHAAPAMAGIPITHRDHASAFVVATGHERPLPAEGGEDGGEPGPGERVDWEAIGRVGGTVIVLMGVGQIERWASGLMRAGRGPETPVAFVRWGSLPRQDVVVTTLARAAEDASARDLRSPVVAVVGEVVRLRESLMTVEKLPLFGQVIGLTRDGDDEASFEALERMGAALHHVPLTRQRMTNKLAMLTDVLSRRPISFTDLVFTSRNGVRAFRQAMDEAGVDARRLAGVQTWAVGPSTAAAMKELLALSADEVPERATAEGLVAHAAKVGVNGLHFLFPAAAGARRVLPDGLAKLGAGVFEIPVYETVPEPSAPARLLTALEEGLTLLTVASPSAVNALVAALDQGGIPRAHVPVAAIGPTTAEAAKGAGLDVAVVPERFNLEALAEAIVAAGHAGRLRRPSPLLLS